MSAADLLPALKSAVDVPWFVGIDLVGTVAFAISGLVLARRDRFSLFGAFVLAALPACGGGILRDVVLGRAPVGFVRTPLYLTLILATVVVGYVGMLALDSRPGGRRARRLPRFTRHATLTVEVCDALGLASFIVTGVVVAVEMGAAPLYLWGPVAAMLTGAGGGILRDVVRADKDNPALKRTFYSEVALIWGLLFSLILILGDGHLGSREVTAAIVATMVGAFSTRMLAVGLRWTSPCFAGERKRRAHRARTALRPAPVERLAPVERRASDDAGVPRTGGSARSRQLEGAPAAAGS